MVSYGHNMAPEGKYIAVVSTNVETSNPEKEVQPGLTLLEPIMQKYKQLNHIYINNLSASLLIIIQITACLSLILSYC